MLDSRVCSVVGMSSLRSLLSIIVEPFTSTSESVTVGSESVVSVFCANAGIASASINAVISDFIFVVCSCYSLIRRSRYPESCNSFGFLPLS